MNRYAKFGTIIVAFVAISMLMSVGTVMAKTQTRVEYETPNPDIHVSTDVGAANAWANVSGSGGIASGEIVVTGSEANWATATASQNAYFEGGDYTASVGAEGLEGGGGSGKWRTSHAFRAKGSEGEGSGFVPSRTEEGAYGTEYTINGAYVNQGASAFRSPNKAAGAQSYKATGADLVVAESSAYHFMCCEGPRVREGTYTGNAEGKVSGSQLAHSESWTSTGNSFDVGLGADISGTEGITSFTFDTDHVSNIDVGSDSSTVFGEAKTWPESSPLDADFDWIE